MIINASMAESGEFFEAAALATLIQRRVAQPSHRDRQIAIGPSSIGDPCDHCVGEILRAKLPGAPLPKSQRFSLAPWIGTGVHLLLEAVMDGLDGWQGESKLLCGSIIGHHGNPDYGEVWGSCDGYHEPSACVLDWKIVGDTTLKRLKNGQTATSYRYQKQTYARGFAMLGKPVRTVMNVYIPRNGTDERDFIFDVDHYDPSMAEEAFERAAVIWNEYVCTDRVHWLESDPDCFNCNRWAPPPVGMKGLSRRA